MEPTDVPVDHRAAGAVVGTVLCVVDRSGGVHPELDALGCAVVSLLDEDELGPD